jgi:hypothetical protein
MSRSAAPRLAIGAIAMAFWCTPGAAQSPPANPLTSAGFAVKYPNSPERQEIINSLPANRVVKRTRNGKVHYVYADPGGCGCAYVGSPQAYANVRNRGPRDDIGHERMMSEMMRDVDQDGAPEQPGSPNGLDYVFGGADF